MNMPEEMDQFQVLEEKIDKLIEMVGTLKREKESLAEKAQIQEERLSDLNGQLENLRGAKDQAGSGSSSCSKRLRGLPDRSWRN